MLQVLSFSKNNTIAIKASGELTREDYQRLQPLLDKTVKDHGTFNLYLEVEEIDKIKPQALWEDFKSYFKYAGKVDKVAVVGDSKITKALAESTTPFVSGEVRYFDGSEFLKAKEWITGQS